MRRKRGWLLISALAVAGGMLYLLLSALTVSAVRTRQVHTTIDDFSPGRFYHTGLTQHDDGEVSLLRIGLSGNWITTTVDGLPAGGIWGHAMVEHNDCIYVLGGMLAGGSRTRNVYVSRINSSYMLDPFTTTTPLPAEAYPSGVYMHSAVVISDHLYVIGGQIDNSNSATDTVMVTTFNEDGTLGAWQHAPPLPDARARAPAVELNGYLYVPGGVYGVLGGDTSIDTVFYAPVDSEGIVTTWLTTTAGLPYRALGHMVTAYNGRLYVMGGYDSYQVQPYVYLAMPLTTTGNIESGGWVSTTGMAKNLMGGVALAFNGELFVLGGLENLSDPKPVGFARSALLDLDSGHVVTYAEGEGWYQSPALSPDRMWHAAVTSRDHRFVYVLGGTENGNAPLSSGVLNRGSTSGDTGGSGYASQGWYLGPQMNLQRDRKLLSFNWTTDIPTTAVTMTLQYRTQDMTGTWSAWSPPIPPADNIGLITTTISLTGMRASRFEYQAWMSTTLPLTYTPYLYSFELEYDLPMLPPFKKEADPPSDPSAPQGVLPGQIITYTLSFTNPNDLSQFRSVLITDTLPPYLIYVPGSITATEGIVPDDTQLPELQWRMSEMSTLSAGRVGFVAVVSPTAEVGAPLDNLGAFMSNDTDDVTSRVLHVVADLTPPQIEKRTDPPIGESVPQGALINYTLVYTNVNSFSLNNTVITDVLPSGVQFMPGSCAPACTANGRVITWTIALLKPHETMQASLAVTVNPDADPGTILTNTASIFGCVTLDRCSKSVSSDPITHTVIASGIGRISKASNPPSGPYIAQSGLVFPGGLITYTLRYTNSSSSMEMTSVVISDGLSAYASLLSCTSGCIHGDGAVSWTLTSIAPGASGQVQFTAWITSTAPDGAQIKNRAIMNSTQGRNDSNPVYHWVRILYDLQLSQRINVTMTLPGSTFTYTVVYTNSGPLTLTNAVITNYLGFTPPGEGSAPAWPYLTVVRKSSWQNMEDDPTGFMFRRNIGTLPPNRTGVMTMVVRLDNSPPYSVTLTNSRVEIGHDGTCGYADQQPHGHDTNPSNQVSSLSRPVQGPDLVVLNAQVSPGIHTIDKPFVVTATIANLGLTRTVTLPERMGCPGDHWFGVEVYAKPSSFTNPGPPTGSHDHAGGVCGAEVAEGCSDDYRESFLAQVYSSLGPSSTTVVNWTVSLTRTDVYSFYIQVDPGLWWDCYGNETNPDPVYGRVLETSDLNNILAIGRISVGNRVYLPIILRR